MSKEELDIKLKQIAEAMENAKGDPKKETAMLMAISDPMDSLQCDSCQ